MNQLDIMSKITIGAVSTIILIIIGLGLFYTITKYNEARCEEMRKLVNDHLLAYNQSAEYFDYRANRLNGQFDLPGDLLAWENLLVNEKARLEYEIINLEDQC